MKMIFKLKESDFMRTSYSTKQKEIILDVIRKETKQFTIKDIYDKLNHTVGLTTIYRLVDKLIEDNILNKEIGKDNTTYYQYLDECNHDNHFYLKCDDCGKVIHIDCDCIKELSNHVYTHHKFITNKEHIIINGKCNNCLKGGK